MHFNPRDRERSPVSSTWRVLVAAFVAFVLAAQGMAQAPAPATGVAPQLSTADLDNLVGRIALYPDDLVAIILPAATNPLQLVQADRFLDKRKSDPKLPIDENWDDSVKALVNYPDIVKMMSNDLDWTSALGEAVVTDQGAVLEAIQAFRRRAEAAGNLKSNDKQVVNVDKTVIEIVPANPEVIYVPQYNPTTVVVAGAPAWGYYPTPYPVYYYPYPPGAAFATGLIWGAAIGAAWGGARWGTNWGGGDININRNTNINTGNINRGNINSGNVNRGNVNAGNRPATGGGGSTAWKPNKQPGQVSGATGRTNTGARVGDARAGGGGYSGAGAGAGASRPTSAQGGGLGGGASGAGANRPSTGGGGASAANRAGSASASPRDNFGGSSAGRGGSASGSGLGGYGSGRQAGMDSSRGAASRSSRGGGGGGRSMSSGGGGRPSGGGGGGGRGGGGGGRGGGRR